MIYMLLENLFLLFVPQDVEIFNASIKDNIAYVKPKASFFQIQVAARIANAEEFIINRERNNFNFFAN